MLALYIIIAVLNLMEIIHFKNMQFYEKYIGGVVLIEIAHNSCSSPHTIVCTHLIMFVLFRCTCSPPFTAVRDIWKKQLKCKARYFVKQAFFAQDF